MRRINGLSVFFISVSAALLQCQTIRSGLDLIEGKLRDQDQIVNFILLRCDPKSHKIKVIDTYNEIGRDVSYPLYSVGEVMGKEKALVVVNGGATMSFSVPAPVGLLLVNSRTLHPINNQAIHGGILCVGRGSVSISPVLQFDGHSCIDAVQRGPFLRATAEAALTADADRSQRTVTAVDKHGKLLIFVSKDRVSLSAVATYMYSPEVGATSVLNMDGGPSSGIIIKSTGQPGTPADQIAIGNINALVASAIAIY